jgi:hypothetical protein
MQTISKEMVAVQMDQGITKRVDRMLKTLQKMQKEGMNPNKIDALKASFKELMQYIQESNSEFYDLVNEELAKEKKKMGIKQKGATANLGGLQRGRHPLVMRLLNQGGLNQAGYRKISLIDIVQESGMFGAEGAEREEIIQTIQSLLYDGIFDLGELTDIIVLLKMLGMNVPEDLLSDVLEAIQQFVEDQTNNVSSLKELEEFFEEIRELVKGAIETQEIDKMEEGVLAEKQGSFDEELEEQETMAGGLGGSLQNPKMATERPVTAAKNVDKPVMVKEINPNMPPMAAEGRKSKKDKQGIKATKKVEKADVSLTKAKKRSDKTRIKPKFVKEMKESLEAITNQELTNFLEVLLEVKAKDTVKRIDAMVNLGEKDLLG